MARAETRAVGRVSGSRGCALAAAGFLRLPQCHRRSPRPRVPRGGGVGGQGWAAWGLERDPMLVEAFSLTPASLSSSLSLAVASLMPPAERTRSRSAGLMEPSRRRVEALA